MRLFIAEKPSLAKAIFEGLGGSSTAKMQNGCFTIGDDKITSCFGHMLSLFDPQDYDEKYTIWRIEDLPIKSIYPPKLKPKPEAKQRLDIIIQLISEADEIVNSADADAEGQLLVDEILTYVGNTKPVKRLLISDLNLKPVQKALKNLLNNAVFKNLGLTALARSIGDQLFGYNLTRAYTLQGRKQGFDGVLTCGRVTSAVIGLINSRTLANLNHQESFYYDLVGRFSLNDNEFTAKYQPTDKDITDEKNRIIDKNNAGNIKNSCNDEGVIVTATTQSEKKVAPLPYNLSSLQQTCAKKWGYSAELTLETMQSLYENHKLTTYPRSDCRYLSEEHFDSREDIFNALKTSSPQLLELLENADLSLNHKAFNTDKITAHHAICPTIKSSENITLTEHEKNIYNLVVSSYVALFYPDSVRDKTRVIINNNGHEFVATQSVLVSQGWEVLFKGDIDADQSINGLDCSTLKAEQAVKCGGVEIEEKKTTPPKYFVESTLLAAMTRAAKFIEDPELRKSFELKDKDNAAESGSIGTEATRASILSKLAENTNLVSIEIEKGYKEKVWKTTQQGQDFCKVLPPEILAPDTSAVWSRQQDLISKGELSVEAFLKTLDSYLDNQINAVKNKGISITPNMMNCPSCTAGFIGRRKGVNGVFWACNNHPDCKTSYPDKNGSPDLETKQKRAPIVSSHKCPECDKGLIRRKRKRAQGKVSYFWGCSGFPECKKTLFDKAGNPNFTER
jgi:DNA topoisomerase-3